MKLEFPPNTHTSSKITTEAVLWRLKEQGDIEDSRSATKILEEFTAATGASIKAFGTKLAWMESNGWLTREIHGRVPKAIRINPDLDLGERPNWLSTFISEEESDDDEPQLEEIVPQEELLSPVSVADKLSFIMVLASQVMVETGGESVDELKHRLNDVLEESNRLRTRLRDATETAAAHYATVERQAERIRNLEANLTAIQGRALDDSGFKNWRRLMQQPPTNKDRSY